MKNRAFTLIELILVLTVLTVAVSIAAPALANFFRGRTLDSEARRLLALTRQGQSRAMSEGLPMDLWIDTQQGSYGLEAEPSFEPTDPKELHFTVDKDVHVEIVNTDPTTGVSTEIATAATSNNTRTKSNHPNLPSIRFLPDGTRSESSPNALRLTGRDGQTLLVALSRNRLNYEIRTRNQ
jgi:prepilin-type N-terminal cleavage/methylation domain-containing protein